MNNDILQQSGGFKTFLFPTSTAAPLKFGNEYAILPHTLYWIELLFLVEIKIRKKERMKFTT